MQNQDWQNSKLPKGMGYVNGVIVYDPHYLTWRDFFRYWIFHPVIFLRNVGYEFSRRIDSDD